MSVKVTLNIPEKIHRFVTKMGDVDGSSAENWLLGWIEAEFKAIVDNNFIIEFDKEQMFELYCHTPD